MGMTDATAVPKATDVDRERIASLLADYRGTIIELMGRLGDNQPADRDLETLNDEAAALIWHLLGEEEATRRGLT